MDEAASVEDDRQLVTAKITHLGMRPAPLVIYATYVIGDKGHPPRRVRRKEMMKRTGARKLRPLATSTRAIPVENKSTANGDRM
jgi:hypothetical protein